MVVVLVVVLVVLLVLAVTAAPWRAWLLDREVARRDGDAPVPDAAVEEIALLVNGPRRVAETAVARLVEAGVLVVAPDRSLHPTGRPALGELDLAALGATAVTARRPTAYDLVTRLRHGPAVEAVTTAARRRGLLHDATAMGRLRRDVLLVVGVVVLLAVVGAAVVGGPTGVVLGASVAIGAVLGGAGAGLAVTAGRRPTRRGRATLAAARSGRWAPAPVMVPGAPPPGAAVGAAGPVALGGLARFPHPEVARLLAPPRSRSGGGFAGGVGSDGGGGGCGDGGGGGGGGGDGGGGGGGC